MKLFLASAFFLGTATLACAQQTAKPEDTEVYEPVPKTVMATPNFEPAPSDALVLFDGKDLSQWDGRTQYPS
jgi:hypothetical protein